MERQMFARGGAVQRFQAGGPAVPMQDNPTVAAAMPTMAMSDTAQLQQMPMEGVMGMAQQAGIDPAQLEQLLGGMADQFQNLDQAEDFEQVMNAMRGDQAPIAARREELAGVVGPEDANATPESVLALVQPVMMMAAVDQGIGGLAAEEMSTPVEGPMAEGIMSMAMPQGAPPPPPMPQGTPPMPGGEGPAPANFRFGGPVVAMKDGGEPGNRLAELYGQQREVYRSLLNPADQQAEMDRQRNMTQAQMLFDVANTALAFAGPGSRSGMSPAERLAEAAQQTQFFDRISQRAGGLETARQEQAKEGRALDLAALQSAGQMQAAEAQAILEASLRPPSPEADVKGVPMSVFNQMSPADQRALMLGTETSVDIKGIPMSVFSTLSEEDQRRVILGDTTEQAVNGIPRNIYDKLPEDAQNRILGIVEEKSDVKGVPRDVFDDLPKDAQNQILGLSPDQQIFNVGDSLVSVNRETNAVSVVYQKDTRELREVNGQLVVADPRTGTAISIFGEGEIAPSEYLIIRDSRNGLTTNIDVSTATGRAAIDAANAANAEAGTTVFTVRTMPSDSTPQAKAFQVGSDTVLSYDGGRTYVSPDGQIRSMPADGVVPLSDTIAYEVMRSEQIRAGAGNQLAEFDERLGLTMRGGDRDNPTSISSADAGLVRDALQAARRGTGPWSGIGALVDNVAGGMIPNQAIRTYFQNNQENRQFLRGVTILGRSALVVNPRFPVAEMERVGTLFPDPDVFFRNPESEALKLIELKSLVMSQYRANLAALNRGISDAATLQAVQANNFEIERLLGLLQTVPDGTNQSGADAPALESLRSTIRGR
jgi:hypothetical protein